MRRRSVLSRRHPLVLFLALLASLGAAATASAHSFAAPYALPVPFWMYAYGASAALVLSFVVVGLVSRVPAPVVPLPQPATPAPLAVSGTVAALQGLALAVLALTVATGLFGTPNPFANFNMGFFWIIFVLGFAYLCALCGDLFLLLNPWRALCEGLQRLWPGAFRPVFAVYPAALGCWPALALFMAFIWLELFGNTTPHSLSVALLAYTAISLAGARLFGLDAWFRHGEFFGVFLGLVARMAPLAWSLAPLPSGRRGIALRWRRPFVGLLEDRPPHGSGVVFILFMLSATAYDGLHESGPWARFFWGQLYPLFGAVVQAHAAQPYAVAARLFHLWQSLALFLSPLVYLACYLVALKWTQRLAGHRLTLGALALDFAHTLVPIAVVYHVTHYYTLLLAQGPAFVRLLSDPFGWGWNLFGTATLPVAPWFIDANTVWHTQVALILVGHVVSVYLAHGVALQVFGNSRRAVLSQLPMLLLMVGLTAAGLWILSLPIASTTVVLPAVAS